MQLNNILYFHFNKLSSIDDEQFQHINLSFAKSIPNRDIVKISTRFLYVQFY